MYDSSNLWFYSSTKEFLLMNPWPLRRNVKQELSCQRCTNYTVCIDVKCRESRQKFKRVAIVITEGVDGVHDGK
ncbi:hypothetical protein L6452_04868 [Arctium lappa]|uniref:Uncharacterized protein n=1 Tax=Arctium lappa TaxID=4217 RepID=A0ACB9EFV0_ARCLA|nr:hypothetical protein L6452_04868 [Arctium lappa]